MSKTKIKLNYKRIILFLILPALLFIFIVCILFSKSSFFKEAFSKLPSNNVSNAEYDIIEADINENYLGIGQERVKGKDGYFTTFTTKEGNKKTYLEYKQNGKSSWSNNPYWENTMETDGCGITAMSIILSGYNKNLTPEDLRKKYYPVLKADNISSELSNTFGIKNSNFYYSGVNLNEEKIEEHLQKDKPVLVCVWNKPNANRWTTDSHYMVLLATDENGKFYVSNPNGLDNTAKASGWYNKTEILPYVAKAMFVY